MEKLKVGVIGCGTISSERHMPSACLNKKVRVVAVSDIDVNKAISVANMFKIPKHYSDYKEMLEKEEIDIIDIATPIQFHKEQAIEAIKQGKHVIVEKPIAANSKDAEEMVNAAKRNKVLLSIYHTRKAYPVIRKIKSILENKEMGDTLLLHFLTTYGELQPWLKQKKWGALWEIAIHRIYLIQYLLENAKVINAETDQQQKNFGITFSSENGKGEIHIINSGFDRGSDLLTIYCEKGKIIAPSPEFDTFIKWSRREKNWSTAFTEEFFSNLQISFGIAKRGIKYLVYGIKILPHYIILNNFIDSILYDKELLVHPEEGLEAVEMIEKIEAILNKSICR